MVLVGLALLATGCDDKARYDGAKPGSPSSGGGSAAAEGTKPGTPAPSSTPRGAPPAASFSVPGPPLRADNAADVKRFPNEKPLDAIGDHINQDMNVRKAPNKEDGDVVVALHAGTPVTKVAKRGQWFLITFADPKDKAKTLAGWTWEQAFFHPAGPGDEKRLCECWKKQKNEATCEAVTGASTAECDRSFASDCDKLIKCIHGELQPTCLDGERLLLPQAVCAKVCKANAGCPNDQICTDKLGTPSVCMPAKVQEDIKL
jgi:hypothetical protein